MMMGTRSTHVVERMAASGGEGRNRNADVKAGKR